MKILYFTKYSRNGGSSRLRSFQYFPYLEEQGIRVESSPLFSEKYLENLYGGKSIKTEVLKGYAKRVLKLFSVKHYDRIVIEKELFPYLPAFVERLLKFLHVEYIVDYDDAVFHNYDLSGNKIIKAFLSDKIDKVMKYSSVVVSGNSYIAKRAENAGAKQIEIVPTVIDLNRYHIKKHEKKKTVIVGWIGTKSTFEKHLIPCMNWIKRVAEENNIHFQIVGIEDGDTLDEKITYGPWSEKTETELVLNFDIGIMPLLDSPWELGKCAYKLIQYMACGLPVIASPVGMNTDVVKHNATGFLAKNEIEWLAALKILAEDVEKRSAFGEAGRKLVEERFCIQVTASQWIKLIRQ